MARRPPPEPIDHHYDIAKLTKVFAITCLISIPALAWMTWQDYGRDWKRWQKEFIRYDRLRTKAALQAAAGKIDAAKEAQFLAQKRDGARELRHRRAALAKAEAAAKRAEGRWYDADQLNRSRKAEMDSARYFYETEQQKDPKSASTKKRFSHYEEARKLYEESQVAVQQRQAGWDAAKAEIARLEKTKTDAEEALKKIDEEYDRFQAKLKTLRQDDAFYFVRNAPIADMLAPNLKVQQVQLDGLFNDVNFLKSQRVDRCLTCHYAADKRGFEDKEKYPQVLRTHPRLDLFVDSNSPHPYATFGCTSCHGGRDGATDFMHSGHMPDDFHEYEEKVEALERGKDARGMPVDEPVLREEIDETQTGRWIKNYGWEIDKYNDLPMYPMRAVEAGCYRCHKNEANHVKAPRLDQGKKLIENLGCWGCHKMKGFEDLPKVGPNLTKLASKTNPDWVGRWLTNPRAFRHNTKMPRFFYLENFSDRDGKALTSTMIAGVTAFLFKEKAPPAPPAMVNAPEAAPGASKGIALAAFQLESSHDSPAAPRPLAGDAARGQQLFESVGCQGCHVSDPKAERHVMDGWRNHGPNLVGLNEKVTPDWLFAWLKNPKAYNPLTRMPNLRLSDEEANDLVAFLLTRPASPEFARTKAPLADAKQRDALVFDYLTQTRSIADAEADLGKMSPHDKDLFVGEKIIANYGCYACHDIAGFEKAKPIGVELSEWGNKPVHLLDFGFVKIPDTRAEWFRQKVHEPRSFDRQKVKTFQEKLKMPQFSLSEEEIRGLESTVLGFQKDDMSDALKARPQGDRTAIEAGRRLVKEYNCQGCHILEDRGGQIRETLKDVGLAPPNIRGEGAKVQSDWLFSFVNAPKTGQIRPWLQVRMPTFEFSEDHLNALTRYFAALEKAPYPFAQRVETVDARSRAAGAKTFEALKCAQCHPTSPEAFTAAIAGGKTPADLAPILSRAHDRLRYDWIADWIKRPDEWMPGTRMPTNFPREEDKSEKRVSPLALAVDTPAYTDFKNALVAIWGTEAEAKAFISDPDRVTKALRDHVWMLGQAPPPARATVAGGGR
jgi:mono/diheme cytochrome c family protein